VLTLVVHLLQLHYPSAAQMGVLKTTMMSWMGSRRSFSSQLHVEDFYVCYFSTVSYSNDLFS
jgi:hypothetical protein